MNVYLIRHGETIHNQSRIHQYSTSPLSSEGRQQAEQLAQRLVQAKIDRIYASPMLRAQETARIIAEKSHLDLAVETLEDLQEHQAPSEYAGRSHFDPALTPIKAEIVKNFHNPDWHYADEENYFDMQARVRRVVERVEKETVEDVLLVTHSHFIFSFVAQVILAEYLTPDLSQDLKRRLTLANTGISHFEYTQEKGWKLITLNDTTHLS